MDEELLEAARAAQAYAYAPYSKFQVGAALRTVDGHIITGANVENVSYPLGSCAERTAFYTAAAMGYRKFVRVAIVGPGPELISPCGACRQVLAEFGDIEVLMGERTAHKATRTMMLSELLPMSFTKEDLNAV